MSELAQRWPGMRNTVLFGIVMALQAGWWMTTDGFGVAVHLPIVFAALACALALRHAFSIEKWMDGARRPAYVRVALIALCLVVAGTLNVTSPRIEGAAKIAAWFGLVVLAGYMMLFTRLAFRIAERQKRGRSAQTSAPKRRSRRTKREDRAPPCPT